MKTFLIILAVVAVLLAGGIWLYNSGEDSVTTTVNDQTSEMAAQVETGAPKLIIGNPDAKITIVEYGDFQCPICKRFFEQTEPQLIQEYLNTNKAKIEFRVDTHIGPDSQLAGEAAYCANDQGQFKPYHDAMFTRQGSVKFSAANLKQIASELGLASSSFDACLDSGKYRQTVIDSNAEAAQRTGNATPTFFIGNTRITGAQGFSAFKTVLDSQQ